MLLYIACVHACEPIFSENNNENIWKCQMWFNCSPPSFWSDISGAFQRQLSFTQRWTDWHMNDDIKSQSSTLIFLLAASFADDFKLSLCSWMNALRLMLEDKVVGFSGFLLLFNQSCEKIKTSVNHNPSDAPLDEYLMLQSCNLRWTYYDFSPPVRKIKNVTCLIL